VTARTRLALGATLLCYLPFFAYVVVVTTPAYALFPRASIFVLPSVLASFCAALLLSARAVPVTAWIVVAVLGVALLDNFTSVIGYLADWELRQGREEDGAYLRALRQSASHAWHWLLLVAPLAAAAVALVKGRTARRPSPRR